MNTNPIDQWINLETRRQFFGRSAKGLGAAALAGMPGQPAAGSITPKKCVHWMNGKKYLEYVKGSDDWNERLAASKFSRFPKFGVATKGHICLQDHGNLVSFRNIKIREVK